MKGYVYQITNSKTSDIYVGSTIQNIKNRFKTHKSNARLGKSQKLYECMREHGIENFKIDVIEECDEKDLDQKEKEHYQLLLPSLNMIVPRIKENEDIGRIYRLIYTLDDTKFYIGSTKKTIKKRLGDHRSASNMGTTPFYTFMREHGKENFDIECVEDNILIDQLIIRENYWIAELKPTLNKNMNLCMTDKERDRLKYIKNREKRLQQVNDRRVLKRDEINAKKIEHYRLNKDQINGKNKQKWHILRETEFLPYVQRPDFTKENLQIHTIFELKGFVKRFGLKYSPKLKYKVIEKILVQQDIQFPL